MQLPVFDRLKATELVAESASSPLSSFDVSLEAHRRWDLKQYFESALLFCVAFERAQSELSAGKIGIDQSPNYFARAAITFSFAGENSMANPMLKEVVSIDWKKLGLVNDSHMTEWAFVQLLQSPECGSLEAFNETFEQAVVRCRELGWEFPRIHPKQEALLHESIKRSLPSIARRLIELIVQRRPISREARTLLRSAEKFVSEVGT